MKKGFLLIGVVLVLNGCASLGSIKKTADRLNKQVIEIDFSLPNGDPFIKTYQIIN